VLEWLRAAYPAAQTELQYADPYQLIVAVILSAQCTDVRVNLTTPAIFARYPTVHDLARATAECQRGISAFLNKEKIEW